MALERTDGDDVDNKVMDLPGSSTIKLCASRLPFDRQLLHGLTLLPTRNPLGFDGLATSEAPKTREYINELESIAEELKKMDAYWRQDFFHDAPTPREYGLYGLILSHASFDIFLSYREDYLRMTEKHHADKSVEAFRSSDFYIGRSLPNCKIELPDVKERLDDIICYWGTIGPLPISFNESLFRIDHSDGPVADHAVVPVFQPSDVDRESDLYCEKRSKLVDDATMTVPVAKYGCSKETIEDTWGEESWRLQKLCDVLRKLGEKRRARSYAPPVGDELICYREIRITVWSILELFMSKACIQLYGCPHPSSGKTLGDSFKFVGDVEDKLLYSLRVPAGHSFAAVFDEFSELCFSLGLCRNRLMDIRSSFYRKEKSVAVGNKIHAEMSQEVEEKKMKSTAVSIESSKDSEMDETVEKTLQDYLLEILREVIRMEFFWSTTTCMTPKEVRLYIQIVEHITSSLCFFGISEYPKDCKENLRSYGCPDKKPCNGPWPNHFESISSVSDVGVDANVHKKTREEFLQQIVSYIEMIKYRCLLDAPSVQVILLYKEIHKHVNGRILEYKLGCQHEVPKKADSAAAADIDEGSVLPPLVRLLKCDVYHGELVLLDRVVNESEQVIRIIFRGIPEHVKGFDVIKWIEEHEDEALNELKQMVQGSSQGRKLWLDMMLVWEQAVNHVGAFCMKLSEAMQSWDRACVQEICSALHVLSNLGL